MPVRRVAHSGSLSTEAGAVIAPRSSARRREAADQGIVGAEEEAPVRVPGGSVSAAADTELTSSILERYSNRLWSLLPISNVVSLTG